MNDSPRRNHPDKSHYIYLITIGVVFFALAIVFIFFPRTKYSELERRDMADFPDVSNYQASTLNQLTKDISQWFSDSEPYRDHFMSMSMGIRDLMGFNLGDPDEAVSFKAAGESAINLNDAIDADELLEAAGNPLADANAKTANSGILVVGTGPKVRALMAFGGTPQMGENFINMTKDYVKALPGVNLYALLPPVATEFYIPTKAASVSKPQKPVLDYIRDHLPKEVKFVDAYKYLAAHTDEDIYLRTDHHWAPLGAFYGAKAFAKVAGVPFKELDSYDKHVVHGFVGSMYGYSKDIAVKNAPEDFVYYTPKGLDHKTTYITYKTNKDFKVTSATNPYEGPFFHKFNDGSSNAYLTFMGGDQHLVKVQTGTPSKRKLLVIKDSYGNPVPGYLFYSFGEIHVVDFRYFLPNLTNYVKSNGITDILFALNIFNAVTPTNMNRVSNLLRQDGKLSAPSAEKPKEAPKKDDAAPQKKESAAPKKEQPQEKPAEAPKQEAPAPAPTPTPAPAPTATSSE